MVVKRNRFMPIFDANSFLITILTFLGVVLTFGAMFPPVAVAIALTIVSAIMGARFKVGSFVEAALRGNHVEHLRIMGSECNGVGRTASLETAVWMLISFSCCFYTLILFDTLGDAVGFQGAYWVLIVMPLMPLCMYCSYKLLVGWLITTPRNNEVSREKGGVEMQSPSNIQVETTNALHMHNS